jgi:hypothetical protein
MDRYLVGKAARLINRHPNTLRQYLYVNSISENPYPECGGWL